MFDDFVNPERYILNAIEYKDFAFDANFCYHLSSAGKYVVRYKHKNGLDDLKKTSVFVSFALGDLDKLLIRTKKYKFDKVKLKREDWSDLDDKQYEFLLILTFINVETNKKKVESYLYRLQGLVNEMKLDFIEQEHNK